jgi:hypothetical protein
MEVFEMRISYLEDVQKITELALKMEWRINNLENALRVILANAEKIEDGEIADKVAAIAGDALNHAGLFRAQ